MTKLTLDDLERRVAAATGEDRELDRLIAETVDGGNSSPPGYSSSVDECIALIARALPGWAWHVGHGPTGIMPYASLHRRAPAADGSALRAEATASTVPLALLHAAIKAMAMDR